MSCALRDDSRIPRRETVSLPDIAPARSQRVLVSIGASIGALVRETPKTSSIRNRKNVEVSESVTDPDFRAHVGGDEIPIRSTFVGAISPAGQNERQKESKRDGERGGRVSGSGTVSGGVVGE